MPGSRGSPAMVLEFEASPLPALIARWGIMPHNAAVVVVKRGLRSCGVRVQGVKVNQDKRGNFWSI